MTETGNLTWGYFFAAIGFAGGFIGLAVAPFVVKNLLQRINEQVDQRINLHVHRALHPNVTVLPTQRDERAS